MFIIPCKFTENSNHIVRLVGEIRAHHPNEKIVVVDSDSSDKSYFSKVREHGAIIEDVANKHWMIGAYWHGYKAHPDEDYYFFLHDSVKVKANLDYLKNRDLVMLAYFNRAASPSFTRWNDRVRAETNIDPKYITKEGKGCYGPMFGCKSHVMKSLHDKGADKLLPNNKAETGIMEGTFGLFFESLGYDLAKCSLYGDILFEESPGGRSGPFPHKTDWQFPIEKFYCSLSDQERT